MEIKSIKIHAYFGKRMLLMIMRTFIFLLCTTVFSLNTGISNAQEKVKIDQDRVMSVDEVFKIIKTQTKYSFIYPQEIFKDAPKVRLKKGVVSVGKLLQQTLPKGKFNVILGANNRITIKEKNKLQQKQVTGKVTDDSGQPIAGVTIFIKGTTRGTSTDFEGSYTITVPNSENVLVFTYLGFATQEITVGNQTIINVTLQEEVSQLDAVTVSGGYYTTSKREATGSIGKMESKAIEQQSVNNPIAALQGRISGLQITPTSGVPGSGFEVQIRGRNSIASGNEPLYVIDGVPYDSNSMASNDTSGSILRTGGLNPFSLIDPSSIKSVEVLKDADATAIYGSRGANGVVLITTKNGQAGKTSFNVNVSTGIAEVTRKLDLLNTEQYLEQQLEGLANDGLDPVPPFFEFFFPGIFAYDQDRYTDWQEELIGGTAEFNNYQASISGGSERTQFLLNGGYYTETTVFPGDFKYKRGSVLAKINHTSLDDKFKVQFSANYAVEDNFLPENDLVSTAYRLPPNAPALYDEEGNINFANSTFNNNPIAELEAKYQSKRFNLLTNGFLSYQITPSLEVKTSLGYTDTNLEGVRTSPSTRFNPAFGLGPEIASLWLNNAKRRSWIIEPQINWEHKLGNGTFKILAGATFQKQSDNGLVQQGTGFSSNAQIQNLSAASTVSILSENKTEYKYNAVFGRLNYNWDKKYIINLTGRRDGSSRFGPGKQFANFGAIGAAWLFSNEDFLKDNSIISFGKLRVSYGTSGNDQIGDYQFLDTYSNTGFPYNGVVGFEPSRLFNPDFAWEVNKKLELGLEMGFLNDHIFLTAAYYQNNSSNQLVGIPLPATTGFNSLNANLDAKVRNTGFELDLKTINIQKDKFNWYTSFNITVPKNKLVSFPGLEGSTFANQFVVGESLNIVKLYNNLGIDSDTGLYEFQDYNNDDIINASDDRQIIEDAAPKFYGGLHNSLNVGNWSLDMFFQYSKQKAYNIYANFSAPGGPGNQPVQILDRWQQPGDQTQFQQYSVGLNPLASIAYSRFRASNSGFTDASYIRLKNIEVAYTIPKHALKNMQCRLYVQGQNLLTITDFVGIDPERIGDRLSILKRWNFGVEINF